MAERMSRANVRTMRAALRHLTPHHCRALTGTSVLAVALCCSAGTNAARPPQLVVTLDGINGAQPGMSPPQLESLWGFHLRLEGSKGFPGCKTASFRVGAIAGAALFIDARWRAAWFTAGVATPSGIRVGSSLAALKRPYGSRLTREHALYSRSWLYYLRRTRAPHWRLRFDVSPSRPCPEHWLRRSLGRDGAGRLRLGVAA